MLKIYKFLLLFLVILLLNLIVVSANDCGDSEPCSNEGSVKCNGAHFYQVCIGGSPGIFCWTSPTDLGCGDGLCVTDPNGKQGCEFDGDGLIMGHYGSDCDDENVNLTGPGLDDDSNGATDSCDDDGDGYYDSSIGGDDCDDGNASMNPSKTWYQDADGDGYWGNKNPCEPGTGSGWTLATSSTSTPDCDDSDSAEHPGVLWVQDEDGDKYLKSQNQCEKGTGAGWRLYEEGDELTDCDDTNPDAQLLEHWFKDADGDGYYGHCTTACGPPTPIYEKALGVTCGPSQDCDDTDVLVFEDENWCQDADGDGERKAEATSCGPPIGLGWSKDCSTPIDCDDSNNLIVQGSINTANPCEQCQDGIWVFNADLNNPGKDGDCFYCNYALKAKAYDEIPYPLGDGDCIYCDGTNDFPSPDPIGMGDSLPIDCLACSGEYSLLATDDTENGVGDGDCKKCSAGVFVNDPTGNLVNDGDCKQCFGGLLVPDDADTTISDPCKKCDDGNLIFKINGESCGTDTECCSGNCFNTKAELCCDNVVSNKAFAKTCGSCNQDCSANQGDNCDWNYATNCEVSPGLFSTSYSCKECTSSALAVAQCGLGHTCIFGECVSTVLGGAWACVSSGPYYIGLTSPILDPSVLSDLCRGKLPSYNPSCEEWIVTSASVVAGGFIGLPTPIGMPYKLVCKIKNLKCGTSLPAECDDVCVGP